MSGPAGGGAPTVLVAMDGYSLQAPAWSPDGAQLVFVATPTSDMFNREKTEVWVKDLRPPTSEPEAVAGVPGAWRLSWHPSDDLVLVSSFGQESGTVSTIDMTDHSLTAPVVNQATQAVWTTDGKAVYFLEQPDPTKPSWQIAAGRWTARGVSDSRTASETSVYLYDYYGFDISRCAGSEPSPVPNTSTTTTSTTPRGRRRTEDLGSGTLHPTSAPGKDAVMAEVFEGDLTDAVFWGADLRGARFRDVNLTDVTITHAWLDGVEVDAFVDRIVINGVDVTAFVNEQDPWYPLRKVLRVSDPESMREGWAALHEAWAETIAEAEQLPEEDVHASVDGEWSFVQTLRHLVLAIDKWFVDPILGEPFHPVGLPNSGSADVAWPGLDVESAPSLSDVLAVRANRTSRLRDHLADLTTEDLARTVDVVENGPHSVSQCISTVFEEEFWHLRYARRDLAALRATR